MRLFAVGLSHRTAPVELRESWTSPARGWSARLPSSPREGSDASWSCCRPAIAPKSTPSAKPTARRSTSAAFSASITKSRTSSARAPLRAPRAGRRAASLSRRRRARFAGRRRAADSRPGQGGLRRRERRTVHRRAHQPVVSFGVRRRQARAIGDRARRRGRLGQLRRDCPRQKDFRRPEGARRS